MSVPKDNAVYLREWAADIRKHSGKSVDADRCDAIADEIANLRARVAELNTSYAHVFRDNETLHSALEESVKLQSHYADLLNAYDGGRRLHFPDAEAWLGRLRELAKSRQPD